MNVVYMHYHFRSGGVTSVIRRQIESLRNSVRPLLLIGETPEINTSIAYEVIPSMAYDRDRTDDMPPTKTAEIILRKVKEYFGREADLFHIHNPTLGKNKDFLDVINYLISKGQNVLLQIHDFSEDGRVGNYQQKQYPINVHYAVLNSRDYNILLKTGLKEQGLHLIPNAIESLKKNKNENEAIDSAEKNTLILYPVRAIRRKNIGEVLLLSLFTRKDDYIGITLEPTSKMDMDIYNRWIKFSKNNNLKVEFGVGINNPFNMLMRMSKLIITTSIKEGFGMSFLEPWIYKKKLLGRKLSDICFDFISKGLDLSKLYDRLMIPVDIIEMGHIKTKILECYNNNLKRFGINVENKAIESDINNIFSADLIDFGILDEPFQMKIISYLIRDKSLRRRIAKINEKLVFISSLDEMDFQDIVEENRSIVNKEYSLERNREILIDVYRKVLKTQVKHSIDKEVLIKSFNLPERISLLLCS